LDKNQTLEKMKTKSNIVDFAALKKSKQAKEKAIINQSKINK